MQAIRPAFAAALLVIAFVLMWPVLAEMNAMDRCAEKGGDYDYTTAQCDFKATHPTPGLWQRHGVTLLEALALGWVGCALLLHRKR
jgi:hypothetical protein